MVGRITVIFFNIFNIIFLRWYIGKLYNEGTVRNGGMNGNREPRVDKWKELQSYSLNISNMLFYSVAIYVTFHPPSL